MFAYPDAARYRLGVNYQQLPTNRPKVPVYAPYQRDGYMNFSDNYGADPNYVNASLKPTTFKNAGKVASTITEHEKWAGEVTSFTSQMGPEDYEQATALWKVLGQQEGHQDRFISNLAGHLSGAKNATIRSQVYGKSFYCIPFNNFILYTLLFFNVSPFEFFANTISTEYFSYVDKDLSARLRDATEAKAAA